MPSYRKDRDVRTLSNSGLLVIREEFSNWNRRISELKPRC